MATYQFPNIPASTSAPRFSANTKTYTSPLTRAVQTQRRGGAVWMLDLNFTNRIADERAELMAFFFRLNGQEHRALIPETAFAAFRRGTTAGSTPVLDGAATRGDNTVSIRGLAASTTVLRAGDYFEINQELKQATTDLVSSGGGQGSVEFVPELRTDYADGQAVVFDGAAGVFMLASPEVGYDNVPNSYSSTYSKFSAVSAFSVTFVEDVLMQLGT